MKLAIPFHGMKWRVRHLEYIFAIGLIFSSPAFAEALQDLEAIVSRYPTLTAFLKDHKAVLEYRQSLKAYMGENESFDEVYEEFIRQMNEVNENVRGFGGQAWAPNADWQKDAFVIKGEYSGSGLEIKREALFTAIEKLKTETQESVAKLFPDKRKIQELVDELKQAYGLLPKEEVSKLKGREFSKYQAKLGGDKETGQPRFQDHPAAQALAIYAANEVFQHNETVADNLYSGDADIIANELKKLRKLSESAEFLEQRKIGIPPEVLTYLNFQNPLVQEILTSYENGSKNMKEFRSIADARIDPQLLARLLNLQAQGVEMYDIPRHLTARQNEQLEDWQEKSRAVREEKTEFKDSHNQKNPYFLYELHEDPARGTLRLKTDSSVELHFIPSPRPFHAFFAGRKTQECVGGRDTEGLSPKRWARAALKGAVSIFTETGDGKMEGMVGITRLVHVGRFWKKTAYDVVDLMSRAIKGHVVVRDERGRPVKYSFFDYFVDRYQPKAGSNGLVISDGNSVSQNIGGGEVVHHSPAYLEDRIIGTPRQFHPFDRLAKMIAKYFPKTLHGYGNGGMIYDGMKGDGTKVVQLVPSSERRKWSESELEDQIMEKLLWSGEIDDDDAIWKRAVENQVRLQSVTIYKRELLEANPEILGRTVSANLSRIERPLMDLGKRTQRHDPWSQAWEKARLEYYGTYEKRDEAAKSAKYLLVKLMQQLPQNERIHSFIEKLLYRYPGSKGSEAGISALIVAVSGLQPGVSRGLQMLRSPKLLLAVANNLTGYSYGWAEQYFKDLIAIYPRDKTLVTAEVVGTVARLLFSSDRSKENRLGDLLYLFLEQNPLEVLRVPALAALVAKDTELRAAALGTLFLPEYKKDLIQVVRSGIAPFVNKALAQRVSETLPEGIWKLPDARSRRQALGPSQSAKIDCHRLYQQLYLQYISD